MSCKVQQSVCSDCVTYVKSRIKFNTFNTFNNVITAADRIKITSQIAVLKEIALDYKGKTIDNVIQQLELRLADSNLKQ